MSHLNMDSTKIGTHSLPLEEDIGNLRLALFTTVSIADTVWLPYEKDNMKTHNQRKSPNVNPEKKKKNSNQTKPGKKRIE